MKQQAAPLPANELAISTKALGLKGEIIACHAATMKAGNEMVQAAHRCGELLLEVQAVLKASKTTPFRNWVEQFLPFSYASACSYLDLHKKLGQVPKSQRAGILTSADSIREAHRLVNAVLPAPDPLPAKSSPPPVPPAEPADDPLYFPTEDGPDVNEDADPAPAVEPKPAKNGAEKPHPAPLVEAAISQYVSPLIRALKNIAKVNGDGEGQTWAKAHAACGTVIECLKEMKKGVK